MDYGFQRMPAHGFLGSLPSPPRGAFGREAPLIMTNGAFRGLAVNSGRHRIRMKFAPRILWYSAAISLAAWLLLAAFARSRGRNRISC